MISYSVALKIIINIEVRFERIIFLGDPFILQYRFVNILNLGHNLSFVYFFLPALTSFFSRHFVPFAVLKDPSRPY